MVERKSFPDSLAADALVARPGCAALNSSCAETTWIGPAAAAVARQSAIIPPAQIDPAANFIPIAPPRSRDSPTFGGRPALTCPARITAIGFPDVHRRPPAGRGGAITLACGSGAG